MIGARGAKPDLVELRNFCMKSAGRLGCGRWILEVVIDRNNNGIPDQYEERRRILMERVHRKT